MPNIFNYPYTADFECENIGHAKTFLLAGLRILQLGKTLQDLNEKKKLQYVSCKQLADILYDVFNYDKGIVFNLLLLFSDYEILEMNGTPFTHNDISKYNFLTMPKVEYVFSLLNNVAYLNMCAMRTPFNKVFLNEHRIFNAACLSMNSVDSWSSIKIANTLNFLRIIIKVDQIEAEKVEGAVSGGLNEEHIDIIEHAKSRYKLFKVHNRQDYALILKQISGIFDKIKDKKDLEDLIIRSWNI